MDGMETPPRSLGYQKYAGSERVNVILDVIDSLQEIKISVKTSRELPYYFFSLANIINRLQSISANVITCTSIRGVLRGGGE